MKTLAIAAAAAFMLAGCASPASTERYAAASLPAATAAAPTVAPVAPAGPDTSACQHFGQLAGPLTTMLSAAAASPASVGATLGEARTLRRDGQLMRSWSSTATPVVNGSQMVPLQLDLFNAGIGVSLLGAGYGDPSAASYAQTAVSGISRVTSDCSQILG